MNTETMSDSQWNSPKPVIDGDLAFPAHVIGNYLPLEEDIPKDFWKSSNRFNKMSEAIFFGDATNWEFRIEKGIKLKLLYPHITACLMSSEPKHEHKIAGIAYLLSLWCSEIEESGSF
jgi:hypothetical protein